MGEPVALQTDADVAERLNRALKLEDFFPEFTPEHAVKLFPRSGLYGYARDQVLVREGEAGHDLFVVHKGRVGVYKGDGLLNHTVATLDPGALIGEIALLREVPRTATVTALEDAHVYRLSYLDVRYILDHNAELSAHLKALAAQRLGL
jgi:CRP-like cAMP-binding protein